MASNTVLRSRYSVLSFNREPLVSLSTQKEDYTNGEQDEQCFLRAMTYLLHLTLFVQTKERELYSELTKRISQCLYYY